MPPLLPCTSLPNRHGCAPCRGPLPSLERLGYMGPSKAHLASVSSLLSVIYSARAREGGTMLVTQQPVLWRFWYATVLVGQLQDGPRSFTLLNENIVLFLDADGRPVRSRTAAAIAPHNSRKVARPRASSCAATTGGHTTGPATAFAFRRPTPRRRRRAHGCLPIAARRTMATLGWHSRTHCSRCPISRKPRIRGSGASPVLRGLAVREPAVSGERV